MNLPEFPNTVDDELIAAYHQVGLQSNCIAAIYMATCIFGTQFPLARRRLNLPGDYDPLTVWTPRMPLSFQECADHPIYGPPVHQLARDARNSGRSITPDDVGHVRSIFRRDSISYARAQEMRSPLHRSIEDFTGIAKRELVRSMVKRR